jgi:hypothetical protein
MNDNFTLNEKLYRYFDGELDGSEKTEFEAELAASSELQESLNALSLSKYAVNRLGLLQQVSAIHAEFAGNREEKESPVVAPVRKINWMRYAMAAAAALVIILGITWLMPSGKGKGDAEDLYASIYKPYDNAVVRSGATEQLEKEYQGRNYKQVIALYPALTNPGAKEKLLTACAYMETGETKPATILLLALQQDNRVNQTTAFGDDVEYYLALCYLKTGRLNEAGAMFRGIRNNPAHLYSDKITVAFMEQFNKLSEKK